MKVVVVKIVKCKKGATFVMTSLSDNHNLRNLHISLKIQFHKVKFEYTEV